MLPFGRKSLTIVSNQRYSYKFDLFPVNRYHSYSSFLPVFCYNSITSLNLLFCLFTIAPSFLHAGRKVCHFIFKYNACSIQKQWPPLCESKDYIRGAFTLLVLIKTPYGSALCRVGRSKRKDAYSAIFLNSS